MPESPPWFTKPWANLAGEQRGAAAAAGYAILGLCWVLLGLTADFSSDALRVLGVLVGVVWVGFGATIVATLRWRRTHGTAAP